MFSLLHIFIFMLTKSSLLCFSQQFLWSFSMQCISITHFHILFSFPTVAFGCWGNFFYFSSLFVSKILLQNNCKHYLQFLTSPGGHELNLLCFFNISNHKQSWISTVLLCSSLKPAVTDLVRLCWMSLWMKPRLLLKIIFYKLF